MKKLVIKNLFKLHFFSIKLPIEMIKVSQNLQTFLKIISPSIPNFRSYYMMILKNIRIKFTEDVLNIEQCFQNGKTFKLVEFSRRIYIYH